VNRLSLNGFDVRVSKYKVTIYDPEDKLSDAAAETIATYLYKEGFITKTEFPVEIVKEENE
jgi:hypothetical protein